MTSKHLTLSLVTAYAVIGTSTFAEEIMLDPIVVGADFREQNLSQVSNSITVLNTDEIYDKSDKAFIETIASVPNVNFTAGASKAKYIQIRGIGERSQYETPVNPSVGLIIDGIDFSQNTLGASLFDIKQVEVLKGPQGTVFGANGLAGVITAESNKPIQEAEGHIEATIGNYNTKAFGLALNTPIIEDTLFARFSLYKNSSDGYMTNSYLKRDDTNNIDEFSAKAQFRWIASENHTIDLTLIHVNVDNGFDAFTLDNTRDSHADKPGKDTLKMDAFALKSTYQINTMMHLVSTISASNSDSLYSYDEDWTYDGEFPVWGYDWFDSYKRNKKQLDLDIRLVSDEEGRIFNDTTKWTIGFYGKNYDEEMSRNHIKFGADNLFDSSYNAKNRALYGQFDTSLNNKLTLITGLRIEKWDAEYSDSENIHIETDETLIGGKIGLNYQYAENQLYYMTLSKGYKPGGFNATNTPGISTTYETETLWNLEGGLNSHHFNNTLISRLNIFYGKRKDQQIKLYQPNVHSFTDYLGNAPKGHYYGLESQLDYYPNDTLHVYSSIGLLKSEIDDYYGSDLEGRAPAQSPEYQYNIGLDYSFFENWMFKTNVEGKGSYYFSNTHEQKSDPYALWHANLVYATENWSASLWVRNITDEEYQTRGFYFANNPGNFYAAEELYYQQGDPRTFGVTLSYDF